MSSDNQRLDIVECLGIRLLFFVAKNLSLLVEEQSKSKKKGWRNVSVPFPLLPDIKLS